MSLEPDFLIFLQLILLFEIYLRMLIFFQNYLKIWRYKGLTPKALQMPSAIFANIVLIVECQNSTFMMTD